MENFLTAKQIAEVLSDEIPLSSVDSIGDCRDADLDAHVDCFLSGVRQTLALSIDSLQGYKDPAQALEMIRALQSKVQAHRATAQALTKAMIAQTVPYEAPAFGSTALQ